MERRFIRRVPRAHAAGGRRRARDHLCLPPVGISRRAARAVSRTARNCAGDTRPSPGPEGARAVRRRGDRVARGDPAYAIDRVEWSLLLFFASLFVVMRGFEQTGAVAWLDDHALRVVQGSSPWSAAVVVSGVMATLSNLISNVPAVILWRHTVPTIPNPDLMWRVLAMS